MDDIKTINAKLKNKTALIELKTGKIWESKNIKLSPTHVSHLFPKSDSSVIREFTDIKRISWRNHRRGAKDGLKFGFMSGASFGAIAVAVSEVTGYGRMGPQPQASIHIVLIAGFYGSIFGSSLGLINGAEERIVLSSE